MECHVIFTILGLVWIECKNEIIDKDHSDAEYLILNLEKYEDFIIYSYQDIQEY